MEERNGNAHGEEEEEEQVADGEEERGEGDEEEVADGETAEDGVTQGDEEEDTDGITEETVIAPQLRSNLPPFGLSSTSLDVLDLMSSPSPSHHSLYCPLNVLFFHIKDFPSLFECL